MTPDRIHDYTFIGRINSGNLHNFMLSMDVTINDIYPAGKGSCFIGYFNESVTAVQNNDSTPAALAADQDNIGFYTKTELSEAGSFTRIMENGLTVRRLTIIRLTGLTFAYVGIEYAGQFNDIDKGPFQLVFGSALYSDGKSAVCLFDNMALRKIN